jgi:hypothetical protein
VLPGGYEDRLLSLTHRGLSAASARPTGRRSPSAKLRSARRLRRNILPWSVERWLVHLAAWRGGARRCYGRRSEAVGRVYLTKKRPCIHGWIAHMNDRVVPGEAVILNVT